MGKDEKMQMGGNKSLFVTENALGVPHAPLHDVEKHASDIQRNFENIGLSANLQKIVKLCEKFAQTKCKRLLNVTICCKFHQILSVWRWAVEFAAGMGRSSSSDRWYLVEFAANCKIWWLFTFRLSNLSQNLTNVKSTTTTDVSFLRSEQRRNVVWLRWRAQPWPFRWSPLALGTFQTFEALPFHIFVKLYWNSRRVKNTILQLYCF